MRAYDGEGCVRLLAAVIIRARRDAKQGRRDAQRDLAIFEQAAASAQRTRGRLIALEPPQRKQRGRPRAA